MSARELRLLSVVAPMLDEEGLAAEFCSRVATSLADLPYELVIVDDEHQTWDFNGEYWKDELGFYRYRISSQCPAKR